MSSSHLVLSDVKVIEQKSRKEREGKHTWERELRPDVVSILTKLIAIDPQLSSIISNCAIHRGVAEVEGQRNIISPGKIQTETSLIKPDACLSETFFRITSSPVCETYEVSNGADLDQIWSKISRVPTQELQPGTKYTETKDWTHPGWGGTAA